MLDIAASTPIDLVSSAHPTRIRAYFDNTPPVAYKHFQLMPILNALHTMPGQQVPATITTWGELLPHYGRFTSLGALLNAVKAHISHIEGRTVTSIMQLDLNTPASVEIQIEFDTPIFYANGPAILKVYFQS
jgi:hypothetical protein